MSRSWSRSRPIAIVLIRPPWLRLDRWARCTPLETGPNLDRARFSGHGSG